MGARRYQDLAAWRFARDLERGVYAFTAMRPVRDDRDFCTQIRRSSASASRNIVEGFARYLPRDFCRFVRIAKASLEETKDHLDAGFELKYLSAEEHARLHLLARRASGAATNLAKYLDDASPPR